MQWNMRLKAAERGIWKSGEMRRLLAGAGLELSAGKMSALWAGTPTTLRLDDDVAALIEKIRKKKNASLKEFICRTAARRISRPASSLSMPIAALR